jgi:hypothetical protein
MITKRICIKEIKIKGHNPIKFGEQFDCELRTSEWGTYCIKINGIQTNSYISMSDLNKMSAELQDIRNLKLILLTNNFMSNKRLKRKILMAQKMGDYHGMLKHVSKSETLLPHKTKEQKRYITNKCNLNNE